MATETLPSVAAHARQAVDGMFAYIEAQGHADYIGEPISQIEHSLQCATLAQNAGADNETILGALLHDVGRFIPAADKSARMVAKDGTYVGRASHELMGEQYLRNLGFSEKICQLVGAHVIAKRYLTAVDEGYYAGLSQSSKTTLKYQGGPFTDAQVKDAQRDPWLQNKLAVRRWDDQAKVIGMATPPLSAFHDMAISSLVASRKTVALHGRTYAAPTHPTVVVCVDGFDPTYLSQGIADGILPNLAKWCTEGFHETAKSCMPSFTNPNNVSIITGAPPRVHGVAGNFFLDPKTGAARMMNDASCIRGSTVLAEMSRIGVRVAAVTAKDKLRHLLQKDMQGGICFSAEKAGAATLDENGIGDIEEWIGRAAPIQYSGDLSVFVFDAGVKLLQEDRADLLYLTLSDFIQHEHAPGSPAANELMAALDERLGRMAELGATVAVTGDHGMNDKARADGTPNVLYLGDLLDETLGKDVAQVVCPISDPYVRHHGALGSFVRVHLRDKSQAQQVIDICRGMEQVEEALSGREAAEKYEMTADTEGDVVVISKKHAVVGARQADHDLSQLKAHRLRSHGGLSEQDVPLIRSRALKETVSVERQWRNYDIFELALKY